MPIHHQREKAEALQREMEEAWTLEQSLNCPIELKGFTDLEPFVSYASKGGVLDGTQSLGSQKCIFRQFSTDHPVVRQDVKEIIWNYRIDSTQVLRNFESKKQHS